MDAGAAQTHSRNPAICTDPEILGGEPVFSGTRVPVQHLFDWLEAGEPLEAFLDEFPAVAREQAVSVLQAARDGLVNGARTAR